MAREQVAENKKRGLDADGRPIKSLDMDRTLEEYGIDPDEIHKGFNNAMSMFGLGPKKDKDDKKKKRSKY